MSALADIHGVYGASDFVMGKKSKIMRIMQDEKSSIWESEDSCSCGERFAVEDCAGCMERFCVPCLNVHEGKCMDSLANAYEQSSGVEVCHRCVVQEGPFTKCYVCERPYCFTCIEVHMYECRGVMDRSTIPRLPLLKPEPRIFQGNMFCGECIKFFVSDDLIDHWNHVPLMFVSPCSQIYGPKINHP